MDSSRTAPWHWLKTFTIELGTGNNAAYNNGNQQIMIVLKVEPVPGATVTPAELATLVPTELLNNGTYRPLPEYDGWGAWGWNSQHDDRFDYYDGRGATEQANPLRKVYYIHTQARANATLDLRAQITQTTKDEDDKDVTVTYYTEGDFLSEIRLQAVRSPSFVFPDHYQWIPRVISGNWERGENYIHEHRLRPKDGTFVEAWFLTPDFDKTTTDGMIRWQRRQASETRATDVGFALPGNSTVRRHATFPHSDAFKNRSHKSVAPPPNGAIVAVVQGDVAIPYRGTPTAFDRPCTLGALDNNGNEHILAVAFSDEGDALAQRTHLAVTTLHALALAQNNWLAGCDIQVSSCSNRAYNNGNQQIEITLSVEPAAGQVISAQQLATLVPIIELPDGSHTALTSDPEETQWWYSSEPDERFDFLPPLIEELPGAGLPGKRACRRKTFYVHTRAEPGATLAVRASIQHEPGNNDSVYQSDNSVELLALAPPLYSPADFRWDLKYARGDSQHPRRLSYEFSLRLEHAALSHAEFDNDASRSMLRRSSVEAGLAAHVAIALPGDTTLHASDAINADSGFKVAELEFAEPGALMFVIQIDDRIAHAVGDDNGGPCAITVHDRHGNRHPLMIGLSDDAFSSLKSASLTVESNARTVVPQQQQVAAITHFQVLGSSLPAPNSPCRLYGNGYQQAYVDILIEAVNADDEIIDLGDLLKNITLVRYPDRQNLTTLNCEYTQTQTSDDKRFDPYPGTVYVEKQPNTNMVRFWIKTTQLTNIRFGALLNINNTEYHTCDFNLNDQSGRTVAGRSNSSALLVPMQKDYQIRSHNVELERFDHENSSRWDLDKYEFRLEPGTYRIAASSPGDNTFVYDYIGDKKTNMCQYFCLDKARTARVGKPALWDTTMSINSKTGVLYATRMILLNHNDSANEFTRRQAINIIDQYGNSHAMYIGPTSHDNAGTNSIVIS
ncbi:hypothetical protein [Pseudomonas sp. NPDC089406]|uniref:hypothetical protein n=1 Tax=Pseudomonas sp. NPDC089406 TaxID=3364463 RepID=UPI00384BAA38